MSDPMVDHCKPLPGVRCDLGEGLVWNDRTHRLMMTDIVNGKLLELDIDSDARRSWSFDEALAWVLPTPFANQYLLGLQSGMALFDLENPGEVRWVNRAFPATSDCRLNDACADETGRVWYGSMNMRTPTAPDGQLASFSPGEGLRIHDSGYTVTNGPVVSPDGRFLFLNDTLQGRVYRYALDTAAGVLSDRQVFAAFDAGDGYPDGMCFDAQGHLWIALWGGASVVQLDHTGQVLRKIAVPAPHVTNVCFGGERCDRLLVSTATVALSAAEAQRYPAAGGVFEIGGHHTAGICPYPAILDPVWT